MNNVAKYRARAKLTQHALAAKIGVSRPLLQRIEAGVIPVRYEKIGALSEALQVPLKNLFPKVMSPKEIKERSTSYLELRPYEMIDYRGSGHQLEFSLRGGLTKTYPVDVATAARVRSLLVDDLSHIFVCFRTDRLDVAINLSEILFARLLFDPGLFFEDHNIEENEDDMVCTIKIFFAGENEPSSFDVDPDESDINEEHDARRTVQLQDLRSELEIMERHEPRALRFIDLDGEYVIIPPATLQVLEIPLENVCPSVVETIFAGMEEDEMERGQEPPSDEDTGGDNAGHCPG